MFGWFKKRDEAERGRRNAERFLASNPSATEIKQYWSSAKEDQSFERHRDGGYSDAAVAVIEPAWRKAVSS